MTFKFIVGAQADRYSFIQIPKILMTDKVFSDMSNWVKITYGYRADSI